jgi:hypothetical protein
VRLTVDGKDCVAKGIGISVGVGRRVGVEVVVETDVGVFTGIESKAVG